MRTTIDLPDDLILRAEARAAIEGQSLRDLVAAGLRLLLVSTPEKAAASRRPARERGSAGAWAKRFAGVARLAPGETTDDARLDHVRKKYGV